ncbi:MAG: cell division protein FtsK [Candidatus Niyogibacteria bacterium CG10_big_fil_rev_8_21_14_0_10_42_19]|uniref:Cell division protein FtsK n=1 Tax=Candidatus Niyogibacteria bacterium CG10_big_fil_rev_8_21_14_0_10_42_19 TaxID=1974725 RepID=A0A2H0TFP4_9BACT|nr:MAG: cell division protein FtsK [Candidatus Niyogibacteria bacterium CG10_big_fil_rev_8_21_14_0_10_42_19]
MMKKNRHPKKPGKKGWFEGLNQETKQSVFAVFSFCVSFILVLSITGRAGVVGAFIERIFERSFGKMEFLIPILFFIVGFSLVLSFRPSFLLPTVIGGLLFLFSTLGAADIVFGDRVAGVAGMIVAKPLVGLFDFWASLIIVMALFVISILVVMNSSILKRKDLEEDDDGEKKLSFFGIVAGIFKRKKKNIDLAPAEIKTSEEAKEEVVIEKNKPEKIGRIEHTKEGEFLVAKNPGKERSHQGFKPIPFDLLEDDRGKPSSGDIKANANIIQRTFKNFGIDVEMAEVSVGPSVTQYTLRPAQGVKLSRITALHNDLALALAAHPIRIEAPIPGRSVVGIEIPNRVIALVGLKKLIGSDEFMHSKHALNLALGKDVSGKSVFASINKMPHLLIAGSTGSGKSVAIHAMMLSLLYRNGPGQLKFLLIDPKRVELSSYSGIPHLLAPVITDAKKAILALKWCTSEMERRYEYISAAGVRDILSYQATAQSQEHPMPYIMIVIDELADIMATYPRELEASIVRLAQMSRAVGIHLVVSTQRPSVEVITGLIKANITSRIAFQVASQVDSRTILDMAGAEKLLGNGDMLFLAGDAAKPRRIQGSFVSEKEVSKIAQYVEEAYSEYAINERESIDVSSVEEKGKSIFDDVSIQDVSEDDLYMEAENIVMEAGKASASYLQRRLRVGYARAARLLDMLEERGIVGPGEGAKAREVYGAKTFEESKKEEKETGGGEDFFKTMQS